MTMTWWVTEDSAATAGMVTAIARPSLRPAARPIHWPRRAGFAVAAPAPVKKKNPPPVLARGVGGP
ncbi:hypothetical protein ACFV0Y_36250, partial [Streptomyces sp. NPDC059569]|uniref:hypothetical protein n=1 Tax=Streptomyces sp. NPDC059569 TaxID=3346869 RepID=UPI00367CEBD0